MFSKLTKKTDKDYYSKILVEKAELSTGKILLELNSVNPFDALFDYSNIAETLSNMENNNPKVEILLEAIKKGNAAHPIFNDPNCYLYLLYLIKNNAITQYEGMDVYSYLLVLMQFTERQVLREEDLDVKLVRAISIATLSENGKLTEVGTLFLKEIFSKLKELNHSIEYSVLETIVLNLSSSGQWLTKIPCHYSWKNDLNRTEGILNTLVATVPFLHKIEISKDEYEFLIPSASLMMAIIEEISSSALKMKFCYGEIDTSILKKFHIQGLHPVSIYGVHVNSNPKMASGYRCGPFGILLHDIAHLYWGSKLNNLERSFVFNEFIPEIESLIQIAEEKQDMAVVGSLKKAINKAYNLNLSSRGFCNDKTRLGLFLARVFGENEKSLFGLTKQDENGWIEFQGLGMPIEDRVYFLLRKMYYELSSGNDEWASMFKFIDIGKYYRDVNVCEAIERLAYKAAYLPRIAFQERDKFFDDYTPSPIKWDELHEKIKNVNDCNKMWNCLAKSGQLEKLINTNCIQIFHPYVKITPEALRDFKQFVKNQSIEENESSRLNSKPSRRHSFRF